MKKIIAVFVIISVSICSEIVHGIDMVIFDLGGVLLHEAETNMGQSLPLDIDIERVNGKPPRIFNRMFEFIGLIFKHDCKRAWIMGTLSGRELVQRIQAVIDNEEFDSFFHSKQERNLIKYGSEFILIPEKLVALTTLDEEGLALVKKCKEHGMRLGILSNWDPESFVLVREKFSELFQLFDSNDVIIPADVGSIKPEISLYEYLIKNVIQDAKDAVFIDDSARNVTAAVACGMKGIVHRNWQQTERELFQ
jgi:FMN phosphatase YigB (HAD superfamily)